MDRRHQSADRSTHVHRARLRTYGRDVSCSVDLQPASCSDPIEDLSPSSTRSRSSPCTTGSQWILSATPPTASFIGTGDTAVPGNVDDPLLLRHGVKSKRWSVSRKAHPDPLRPGRLGGLSDQYLNQRRSLAPSRSCPSTRSATEGRPWCSPGRSTPSTHRSAEESEGTEEGKRQWWGPTRRRERAASRSRAIPRVTSCSSRWTGTSSSLPRGSSSSVRRRASRGSSAPTRSTRSAGSIPVRLPRTDLASVPLPLRWLVSNYGVHTPAALIHDWMIDTEPIPDRPLPAVRRPLFPIHAAGPRGALDPSMDDVVGRRPQDTLDEEPAVQGPAGGLDALGDRRIACSSRASSLDGPNS